MTETLTPLSVIPRHDVHPQAYHVTDENLLDLAVHLSLDYDLAETTGETRIVVDIDRRYSLRSTARVGDWIIVHPGMHRNIEILTDDKFAEQYDRLDADLLDMAVSEEFPDATAWALVADTPEGVQALAGRGIVSPSHMIGLAYVVAGRIGARS